MKKALLFKKMVVVVLSIVLVASLSSIVFAADNNTSYDGWDDPSVPVVNTNTGNTGATTNVVGNTNTTNTNTNTATNTNTSTNNTGNATTKLDTNNTNENNEVNSLAYTGVEDNSILAIVIVLGVIVAVYSFKKVKEYNSL